MNTVRRSRIARFVGALTGAAVLALEGISVTARAAAPPALTVGSQRLTFPATPGADTGAYGVRIEVDAAAGQPAACYVQPTPCYIDVVTPSDDTTAFCRAYHSVVATRDGVTCQGTITTPAGTRFDITDRYATSTAADGLTMSRAIHISTPNAADRSFNSEYYLTPNVATTMHDDDFFVPGNWYAGNAHVPAHALAADPNDIIDYIREDRLPLPLVAARDRRSGATLLLAHIGGIPSTIVGDDFRPRIINAGLQFGAIGIRNVEGPSPSFIFPGSEGQRTYIWDKKGWAYRSHPVAVDVPHAYRLLIRLQATADFPTAVADSWRTVYDVTSPAIVPADLTKVYESSFELLSALTHRYNGVPDVPFCAQVPDGHVTDTSSQMGFVGEALPVAALLLRYGTESHQPDAVTHAKEVLDLWATRSFSEDGTPRTWYDVHPDGRITWRDYHTFLRVASDGFEGALQAWNYLHRRGEEHPAWLTFCRRYGNWLVQMQNADGSYAREYDFSGRPVNPTTDTTDQAIPFLVDLYRATGESAYREAALRAGDYCWTNVHLAYAYVGGTPDNPNVLDKEGGLMALSAFLALYDLTGDTRYVAAATQAAWFSESFTFCWNIPSPDGDPKVVFPRNRTTVGISLIATGHSSVDNFMACAPFLFYRVYLLSGEKHFRDSARMLLYNTKQMVNWDGALGYAYNGLLTEAFNLCPPRGHGLTVYLPWLSVVILDPMTHLKDVFGSFDFDAIESLSPADRVRRNAAYGRTRGLVTSTASEVQPQ